MPRPVLGLAQVFFALLGLGFGGFPTSHAENGDGFFGFGALPFKKVSHIREFNAMAG